MSENRIEARLQGPVFLANDLDADAASSLHFRLERGCEKTHVLSKAKRDPSLLREALQFF